MSEPTGPSAVAARAPFHVLVKPIGPLCNLDCEYCFYLDKSAMFPRSKFRMSEALLATHVRQYIESQPPGTREVNFAWQGGEPTLLGVDFFRRVVELQRQCAPPSMRVTNALQTNGVKLDREWCAFLREHEFLVGISVDGPREFHDRFRRTKGGKGTFRAVRRGLDLLVEEGVEFNVLTVVQRHNGDHPLAVYEGLKALGARYLQFIPIVERTKAAAVSARSVLPAQFGQFLVAVFERWRRDDIGEVFVQHFDTALNAVMGNPNTLCVHAPECGRSVALEHNGDLFACDHYVFDEYRLGNIAERSYVDLLDGAEQSRFGRAKLTDLPPRCVRCPVRYMCNGGCPAHRFVPVKQSAHALNYLCEGYERFFGHAEPYLHAMKSALENGLPAKQYYRFLTRSNLRPRRNEPCPCGSGRKFKQCCGRGL